MRTRSTRPKRRHSRSGCTQIFAGYRTRRAEDAPQGIWTKDDRVEIRLSRQVNPAQLMSAGSNVFQMQGRSADAFYLVYPISNGRYARALAWPIEQPPMSMSTSRMLNPYFVDLARLSKLSHRIIAFFLDSADVAKGYSKRSRHSSSHPAVDAVTDERRCFACARPRREDTFPENFFIGCLARAPSSTWV